MEGLGAPVAYPALPEGALVYDPAGAAVGNVEHVLADERSDVFHGLVVHIPYVRDGALFAAPDQIAGLFERGVALAVPVTDLHDPSEDPVAADAADVPAADQIRDGLRRAWEWLGRPR